MPLSIFHLNQNRVSEHPSVYETPIAFPSRQVLYVLRMRRRDKSRSASVNLLHGLDVLRRGDLVCGYDFRRHRAKEQKRARELIESGYDVAASSEIINVCGKLAAFIDDADASSRIGKAADHVPQSGRFSAAGRRKDQRIGKGCSIEFCRDRPAYAAAFPRKAHAK